MNEKLLVCLPAYNEGENIGVVLENLKRLLSTESFDILVIDDGSTDNTAAICKNHDVRVLSLISHLGYCAALVTAYRYAVEHNYQYVVQMDADGQHDVHSISDIAKIIRRDDSIDIVIGSRFLGGVENTEVSWLKKIAIRFYSFFIKLITGNDLTDITSGLQGLSRRAFQHYSEVGVFAVDYPDANMLLYMSLRGYKIHEIPAVMYPRRSGVGMHSGLYKPLKYMAVMLVSVFGVCLRHFMDGRSSVQGVDTHD